MGQCSVAGGGCRRRGRRPRKPPRANVDQLVNRLGSGAYRDREAASRELDALGPTALDALRKAAASADPETRRRATDLIERIGARLSTARILAPTLVEFKYDHTPLLEAVEDLKRRTGAAIRRSTTPAKFQGRTVTAATAGPVPFWDAIDLFCQKADLHQWDGFSRADAEWPQAAAGPGPATSDGQMILPQRPGRANSRPRTRSSCSTAPTRLPTGRSGAVRVRVPPPGTPIEGGRAPTRCVAAADLGRAEVALAGAHGHPRRPGRGRPRPVGGGVPAARERPEATTLSRSSSTAIIMQGPPRRAARRAGPAGGQIVLPAGRAERHDLRPGAGGRAAGRRRRPAQGRRPDGPRHRRGAGQDHRPRRTDSGDVTIGAEVQSAR